ncbi:MAG: acetylglutamate kinase [Myxococcales bacterium]|nr:acetylglutamate kinase [Myxococcales bacterium]
MTQAVEARRAPTTRALQPLRGRVVVIKIGGSVAVDPDRLEATARDVAALVELGARPVVVHGGGPEIDAALRARGRAAARHDGIRATDAEALDVVETVLEGRINPRIVAALGRAGLRAVGLSGRDASWLRGEAVAGRVGRPTVVSGDLARRLVGHGYLPVVAPLFVDAEGHALNVNADTAAGAIAAAIDAFALVLVTDTDGVRGAAGSRLAELPVGAVRDAIDAGVVTDGMIPKLEAACVARRAGVPLVLVIGARRFGATAALLGGQSGTRVI